MSELQLQAAPQTLMTFDDLGGSCCSRGPRPFQHASALPPARSQQTRRRDEPTGKQQRQRARQQPYSARYEQRAYTRKRFESDFLRKPKQIFTRAERSFDRNREVLVTPLPAVLTGRVLLASAGGAVVGAERGFNGGFGVGFGGAAVSRMGSASTYDGGLDEDDTLALGALADALTRVSVRDSVSSMDAALRYAARAARR